MYSTSHLICTHRHTDAHRAKREFYQIVNSDQIRNGCWLCLFFSLKKIICSLKFSSSEGLFLGRKTLLLLNVPHKVL